MLCRLTSTRDTDRLYTVDRAKFLSLRDLESWVFQRGSPRGAIIEPKYSRHWFQRGTTGAALFLPPVAELIGSELLASGGRHRAAVLWQWGGDRMPLAVAMSFRPPGGVDGSVLNALDPQSIAPDALVWLPDLPLVSYPER